MIGGGGWGNVTVGKSGGREMELLGSAMTRAVVVVEVLVEVLVM